MRTLLADRETVIAVVGATENREKYGNVIYRDLKRKGYRVRAVNPNRESVDGDPSYASLSELPERPDIIDLVVPARVGLEVVEEAHRLGYENVWVQPGAESPALLDLLQERDMEYVANRCIMVESRLVLGRT